MNTQNALAIVQPQELMRQSTDVAGVCKEIVVRTSKKIGDRNFVAVEGWMSVATAHGCIASAKDVVWVPPTEGAVGGFKSVGEVRRISDGALVSQGEGFVGTDEATWFGGESEVWDRVKRQRVRKLLPKRPDYAIRAMAQTRAISRACRSAFAHIVVLMDAGLSTTPAEEVPDGGFDNDAADERQDQREQRDQVNAEIKDWREVKIHFGKNEGKALKDLTPKQVMWYRDSLREKRDKPGKYKASAEDLRLLAACEMALPPDGLKSAHGPANPVHGKRDEVDEIPVHVPKLIDALKWAGHTYTDLQDLWPSLPVQTRQMIGVEDVADETQLTEADAMRIYSAWDEVVLPALDTIANAKKK